MAQINNISVPKLSDISLTDSPSSVKEGGANFSTLLKKSLDELNVSQEASDKALADMASGQIKDLHQAAIAIGKAETSMKLMLEVRNKAISAYKEILRTQV
ncbi:flagellar hook-basal body complex protein FliE [Helicobacter sp. 11S02629-2]|uniref:flagellar hook-basal body complex protein FliE n=1 Tax=Helicobacter sp. 11S02629-2 TaxID=1476195 RepID=UPI000BA58BAB|nr:flagellar hook-basal body complex protein FliE [Helicobacter sp. 11S02629-2]PAF45307.1 flagellar hook-basal body complex protein FliE [Helicobacter sp. 11S02629-2]